MSAAHSLDYEAQLCRDVLEALPQSLYAALPWPTHTVATCVKIVAEAQRTNCPRRVRKWIDFERSTPNHEVLLGCLDNVLHRVTLPGEAFAERVKFANKIRQDALDYFRSTATKAAVQGNARAEVSGLVAGLMTALRLHDASLADHSVATAELAERLAIAAGCDAETVSRAKLTGQLHDIGKMKVAASILAKPLPLTAKERDEARAYVKASADTLASLPTLSEIAPFVRAHREWVDGSGYPASLVDRQIPIESRIVSIVDTFHTLTLARPYRQALRPHEAVSELMAGRGTQFDAKLVDTFADMIGYRARVALTA